MEITHPFHPFRGQRLEWLKTRRVGGQDQFVLRRPSGGTFPVARDWTDRADPTISELVERPIVHDFEHLRSLVKLIKDIVERREDDNASSRSDAVRTAGSRGASSEVRGMGEEKLTAGP